ncbi:MAG TPA: hypothetical protein VGH19_03175 [Verrucomicrobiae bacterium]
MFEKLNCQIRGYAQVQMILLIAIFVSALTAALFFKDFFDDHSDFTGCLFENSRDKCDNLTAYLNDPEGADDNGVSRLKLIAYLAVVIGSGVLVYLIFTNHFGSDF